MSPENKKTLLAAADKLGCWEELKEDFCSQLNLNILSLIKHQRNNKLPVYPEATEILSSLKNCPYEKVRVVFIAQDPYPYPCADGMCFSSKNDQYPLSLKVIFNELKEYEGTNQALREKNYSLKRWAEQGVLLLNTILTVGSKPLSHARYGWQEFTRKIIEKLNEKEVIVWMLFGNEARQYRSIINKNHYVIEAYHPATAGHGNDMFTNNFYVDGIKYDRNKFEDCNKFLNICGLEEIKW